jgi:hypothetical protein
LVASLVALGVNGVRVDMEAGCAMQLVGTLSWRGITRRLPTGYGHGTQVFVDKRGWYDAPLSR